MKGESFFQTGYPMIYDNGFSISDLNAILRYLSMKANRTDLLGATPQIQVISLFNIGKNKRNFL